MKPLLEAKGIAVTAPAGEARVAVLRDLDLALRPGAVLGLVGESGAGKSMVGRLIGGILPPGFAVSAGTLSFAGRDMLGLDAKQHRALLGSEIGFIPQQPMTSLNPVRTVGSLFDEHLAKLGTATRGERPEPGRGRPRIGAASQSHGAAAALRARAVRRHVPARADRNGVREPAKLLIADEPTTALDVITQARIMALLADLRRKHGTSVLFVTHDLRLAAQVCDEIAVMYAGEVVERAPARALLSAPRHPYTRALRNCSPSLDGAQLRLVSCPSTCPA